MADINQEFNFSTNFTSIVSKITKGVSTLNNNFSDLIALLQDFAKANAQAAGSMSTVGKASVQAGKSSGAAVTGISKLKKALGESSAAARRVIKDLDPGLFNLDQLSTKEIEQFANALREAGSSLSGFLSGDVIGEFDRADQAVQSLSKELRGLSGVSQESGPLLALADLSENREEAEQVVSTIDELQKKLRELGPAAESGNQQAIADYEKLTNELDQATQ